MVLICVPGWHRASWTGPRSPSSLSSFKTWQTSSFSSRTTRREEKWLRSTTFRWWARPSGPPTWTSSRGSRERRGRHTRKTTLPTTPNTVDDNTPQSFWKILRGNFIPLKSHTHLTLLGTRHFFGFWHNFSALGLNIIFCTEVWRPARTLKRDRSQAVSVRQTLAGHFCRLITAMHVPTPTWMAVSLLGRHSSVVSN